MYYLKSHSYLWLSAILSCMAVSSVALAASTTSDTSVNVYFGDLPAQHDSQTQTDGPANRSTYALSSAAASYGSGSASGYSEAEADTASLHARGSLQLAAAFSSGSVGLNTNFEDQITIGGVGPQTFRLFYSLTGFAGQIGTAALQFDATLSVQAWGTGITILEAPPPTGFSLFPPFIETYSVSASGTTAKPFGEGDSLLIQANSGSVLILSGFLNGSLSLNYSVDNNTPQTGTLDIWDTGSFWIVPVTAGTSFTASSGHDYLATPVPLPTSLILLISALPVLAGPIRRRIP